MPELLRDTPVWALDVRQSHSQDDVVLGRLHAKVCQNAFRQLSVLACRLDFVLRLRDVCCGRL